MRVKTYIYSWAVVFIVVAGYLFYCFVFDEPPGRLPPDGAGVSLHADAIVVLTGGRGRTDEGLTLLRKGAAGALILSGVNEDSGVDAIFLKRLTISERPKIILEKKSKSTYGNAVEVRRIMSEKGFKSMTLVTSDYHMKRAYYIFTKIMPPGMDITAKYPSAVYTETPARKKEFSALDALAISAGEFFKYYWHVFLFNCGLA
ncbi:MAG: YdcF family protein [Deltaproteobacteria bacterium]|nr:YdcF family protein [Deltaproteobacteria bacterium]